MAEHRNNSTRRQFMTGAIRGGAVLSIGGLIGHFATNSQARETVWQIDPHKCTMCGLCATECVLAVSAVKCHHAFAMCGYCDLCTGYFEPQPNALNTGAENQLCPTGAIVRSFVEDPYYEYEIDKDLCVGCAKCVKGCNAFGNGSLYLQIDHGICTQCNECRIAINCPAEAIGRVPADEAYISKQVESS